MTKWFLEYECECKDEHEAELETGYLRETGIYARVVKKGLVVKAWRRPKMKKDETP